MITETDVMNNREKRIFEAGKKQALTSFIEMIDERMSIWKEVLKEADNEDRKQGVEAIISLLAELKGALE